MTPAVLERLLEQPITALTVPPAGKSAQLDSGVMLLCGWAVAEATGSAPAQFALYDGADTNGELLAAVVVPQADSRALGASAIGIAIERSLYFDAVSGSVTGSIWVRMLEKQ